MLSLSGLESIYAYNIDGGLVLCTSGDCEIGCQHVTAALLRGDCCTYMLYDFFNLRYSVVFLLVSTGLVAHASYFLLLQRRHGALEVSMDGGYRPGSIIS